MKGNSNSQYYFQLPEDLVAALDVVDSLMTLTPLSPQAFPTAILCFKPQLTRNARNQ
jgi:hypothetical protein